MMVVDRTFRELADGYLLEFGQLGTEIRVERLRRERFGLTGEMTVSSRLPGTRAPDGVLFLGDVNLSRADDRPKLGKQLDTRANADKAMFGDMIEETFQRILIAERNGRPAVALRDVPRPAPGEDIEVDPGFRLLRRHPVVMFGDGGDAKSYLGLYAATRLASAGLRVLYADWEFAGEDHRDRLERITGADDMPEGILYVRCERPMIAEADRLRRIVREEAVDYLIADSIAFGCDGPPEAAEVAGNYFRGLRRVGIGSLLIAHITKGENGDAKPFGSSFWHNGARSTWFAKRSAGAPGSPEITVGLYNRKANTGPLAAAIAYRIAFTDERTTFQRVDLADVGDLAARLPVVERMTALLGREGALTMAAIAGELDVPTDTIVKTTKRHEGRRFVRLAGEDGIYRIGLLARDAA